MVTIEFAFIIFSLCMAGCAATSWHLGKQVGADEILQYLSDEGIISITYDEEE